MPQNPDESNVIEIPGTRERALLRLLETLSTSDIPLGRLWSMCRVVESLAQCNDVQAQQLEELAAEAANGLYMAISYSRNL